jgi:diaminopimelate epimerase
MSATGIKFTKMSAGGNDFIVIDNVSPTDEPTAIDADFIQRVCARALSVGGDGLIVLEPSGRAHVKMSYFNADGGRAALCGNGVRCVARMTAARRWAPSDGMTIETDVGDLHAALVDDEPWFRLPLGQPTVEARVLTLEGSLDEVSHEIEATYVMAGVPHLLVESRDAHAMDKDLFLSRAARLRGHEDLGPDGANVDFITIRDRNTLDIRCFERGIEGETLSSGSGCIAAALAATGTGKADSPIVCRSRAGFSSTVTLEQETEGTTNAVLAGDARIIYTGVVNAEALTGFDP